MNRTTHEGTKRLSGSWEERTWKSFLFSFGKTFSFSFEPFRKVWKRIFEPSIYLLPPGFCEASCVRGQKQPLNFPPTNYIQFNLTKLLAFSWEEWQAEKYNFKFFSLPFSVFTFLVFDYEIIYFVYHKFVIPKHCEIRWWDNLRQFTWNLYWLKKVQLKNNVVSTIFLLQKRWRMKRRKVKPEKHICTFIIKRRLKLVGPPRFNAAKVGRLAAMGSLTCPSPVFYIHSLFLPFRHFIFRHFNFIFHLSRLLKYYFNRFPFRRINFSDFRVFLKRRKFFLLALAATLPVYFKKFHSLLFKNTFSIILLFPSSTCVFFPLYVLPKHKQSLPSSAVFCRVHEELSIPRTSDYNVRVDLGIEV